MRHFYYRLMLRKSQLTIVSIMLFQSVKAYVEQAFCPSKSLPIAHAPFLYAATHLTDNF
jgi:hypothetical protein